MDILTLSQINAKIDKLQQDGAIGRIELSEAFECLAEQVAAEEMLAVRCPNVGDKITAYLNGVAYTQTARSVTQDGVTYAYIGNGAEFGDETDDNFLLAFVSLYNVAVFVPFEELAQEKITISATCQCTITHPIDKAYIPKWDIGIQNTDDGTTMTANGENIDIEKAREIAKSGIPCAVTSIGGYRCYIPCSILNLEDGILFMAFTNPADGKAVRYQISADGIKKV